MSFAELGLQPGLLKAVDSLGYTEPTPIQEQAIPVALTGRDILGCAQTGTGKTAAFILPALQLTDHRRADRLRGDAAPAATPAASPYIRTLVVTPTRELAGQIEEVAVACSRYTGQRVAAVYGGVGYDPQLKKLRRGVDLLVATPGRLLDLHQRRDVDLSQVEILVLDEADRMLDMGFWPDVRRIMSLLPDEAPEHALLRHPHQRRHAHRRTHPRQSRPRGSRSRGHPGRRRSARPSTRWPRPRRPTCSSAFSKRRSSTGCSSSPAPSTAPTGSAAIWSATASRAPPSTPTARQSQRQHALDGFKNGTYRVLVATDIVARGIDVDSISHVINYDLPVQAQDYVHRIGRTARAGASGTAISFLAAEQAGELREIEVMLGEPLPCRDLDGFAYMERLIPNPERTAKKAKPRLVYNGSARAQVARAQVARGAGARSAASARSGALAPRCYAVRRRTASQYFSRVFSTTSAGSTGAGGSLFHLMASR